MARKRKDISPGTPLPSGVDADGTAVFEQKGKGRKKKKKKMATAPSAPVSLSCGTTVRTRRKAKQAQAEEMARKLKDLHNGTLHTI